MTDIAHSKPAALITACDSIERLTRNPDLLARAAWARKIATQEQETPDTAATAPA